MMKKKFLTVLLFPFILSCNNDKRLFEEMLESDYIRKDIDDDIVTFSKRRSSNTTVDSLVFLNEFIQSYHYIYKNELLINFYYSEDKIYMYEGFLAIFIANECYSVTTNEEGIRVFTIIPAKPLNYNNLEVEILSKNVNDTSFVHQADYIFEEGGSLGYFQKEITEQTEYLLRYKLKSLDNTHQILDSAKIVLKICED